MTVIRPLALGATLACLFLGSGAVAEPLTSSNWKFSATLPCTSQATNQTVATKVGDIVMSIYGCETGAAAFAVIVSDLPQGSTISYDGAVSGAVTNVGGTLRSTAPYSIGGATGREVFIDIASKGEVGRARFVVIGLRLYQTICVVPAGEETHGACPDFLDSFRLLN